MFTGETIAEVWRKSTVAPIPKKGDMYDPNNYRGISLISVLTKIITKVAHSRLTQWSKEFKVLVPEQAGFRKSEECAAHVCALIDILQRRRNQGKDTHVVFLDFKEAFDTVPTDALLYKLRKLKVPNPLLKFFETLHGNSIAQVRIGASFTECRKNWMDLRQT